MARLERADHYKPSILSSYLNGLPAIHVLWAIDLDTPEKHENDYNQENET